MISHAPANLCEYLAASAREHAARSAVVDPEGESITYEQLDELSDRVAGFLVERGVVPGDRVGIIAPKSADVVAVLFGIMKAGAAYVPADFKAPPARNRTLLTDCQAAVVFLHAGSSAMLDEWPADERPLVVWMNGVPESGPAAEFAAVPWASIAAHAPLVTPRFGSGDSLAYILYTSGSTGIPKGVAISQTNATSFVEWCSRELSPTSGDRFSSHAPFHFDLSILDIYACLKHGAELNLISDELGKDPQRLAEFIAARKLTVWYSTPSILSLLAQFGHLERHDCSALRLVLFAGEVFPVKHLRRISAQWPQAEYLNLYGPTETNVCTFFRVPLPVPDERTEPYPIGPACSHCEALVLDEPAGVIVKPGEEGLLHIAGPSLFQGYWHRQHDGLFFERDGRRWYNTGDVVVETSDDGYVYRGRRDRMVKRRGFRIELGEIERGLYQHDRLREAAVVATPDQEAGVRIVAFVVPVEGRAPTIVELKGYCAKALPSYMNPDAFVTLAALPRTSTDKVDYQQLVKGSLHPV